MPALPATFNDFLGNSTAIEHLRTAIAAGRLPHSLILAGPSGAGKYTLALMLAMAVECERQPRDLWSNGQSLASFCGVCHNCTRIASAAHLEDEVDKAVAVREELREVDKKDTRVLIQPHPDVLIIPPDPPQNLIKIAQVRQVIHNAYYRPPVEAKRSIFLFTSSAFMKEAANSLLKVLEEPPPNCTLILLSENPGELLPTIRSRSMVFSLSALPVEEVERYLANTRPEWKQAQRALVARLSEGALGRARTFDVDAYVAARGNALTILNSALLGGEHTALFKITESYRPGAEGREKTEQLLRTLYSLLRDLMFLGSGAPEMVQNTDIQRELSRLAEAADFDWIAAASDRLAEVERGMRRNLLRSLSLDALSLALEKVI